jgi:hypothetical protein
MHMPARPAQIADDDSTMPRISLFSTGRIIWLFVSFSHKHELVSDTKYRNRSLRFSGYEQK